ncbi:arylesterase [Arhodomonas sp. AD133]|uniref:arylesterase n=1 Tax=Arhodomonas sp. AD133 TaxID=3415009 RepID=UPI003EC0E9CC
MLRILLLVGCLILTLPAVAGAPLTILIVGDSLSAGYGLAQDETWVARLRQRLTANGADATVINASISGDTTRGGRARLPAVLEEHEPDVVIIELGGNDGLRGLPLAETRRNLDAMVDAAQTAGARVLLVGVRLPSNYGTAFVERFQQVFRDVASDRDIPLVPKFLAGVAEKPTLMQDDGIHPNAAAQPKLLANVWPKLESLLEEGKAVGNGQGAGNE